MSREQPFKLTGLFLPEVLVGEIGDQLYSEAGVIDVESYYESHQGTSPRGDPASEVLNIFLQDLVVDFASLYDAAAFEAAEETSSDNFKMVQVAAEPEVVHKWMELVNAASLIQETETRVVHTAILHTALERHNLPELPEEKIL